MKLKQLLETGCECDDKKTKVEEEEMTAITDKDYKVWCKQIGMKGQDVDKEDFVDAAWEVLDNDSKLSAANEKQKGAIITKLWKIHQGK